MNHKRDISSTISVADQPTSADLETLKSEGYTGVVNLRNDGEPDQPLSTEEEGKLVRELGMDYLHFGVGGGPLSEENVSDFCDFLHRHADQRVFVHCRKGGRAAALVLLHQAIHERWEPQEVVSKGRAMGLEVEGGLRTMVENYLQEHHFGI
jgi:uncharacterized protein (TIGR01244 family)